MRNGHYLLSKVCFGTAWTVLACMALLFSGSLVSCRDEYRVYREGEVVLQFSQDTVRFDTLFTTQASVTQRVMVRNPYQEAVMIDRIYLQGGGASRFRVNVSGDTSLIQHGVVIGGKDSLFVFVNTAIDYRNQDNPFELVDYLCFEVGSNPAQRIVLTAWGQDANYWKADRRVRVPFSDPGMFNPDSDSLTLSYFLYDETRHSFADPKPYVIYGYLAVEAGKTLIVPAGTRVYFAPQSGIWIQAGAKLRIEGTLSAPVVFTSLRQDGNYRDMAGQWGRVWLSGESGPHEVEHAILRNGQTGFWIDSCIMGEGGLKIRDTRIENMSSYGIFCQQNRVEGVNLCLSQAQSLLYFHKGGSYEFVHCTFSNSYSGGFGGSRCLHLDDYEEDFSGNRKEYPLEKLFFANSTFTGASSQQLWVDLAKEPGEYSQIGFDHCLLMLDPVPEDNAWFDSCQWNQEPLFADEQAYDFRIDTVASPLVGRGNPVHVTGVAVLDLAGNQRNIPPSIGAYEFLEKGAAVSKPAVFRFLHGR